MQQNGLERIQLPIVLIRGDMYVKTLNPFIRICIYLGASEIAL